MQISSILRLRFTSSVPAEQPLLEPEPAARLDFVAYGEDCLVSGATELIGSARLTDMLNRHDGVELVAGSVEPLDGRQPFQMARFDLSRDEILLVAANGPRGDANKRTRTRPHGVAMQLGPYTVHGYLHALPGADPLTHLHRRAPMVPLTDASVEYRIGTTVRHDAASLLIVNRDRIAWLSAAAVHTAWGSPQMPLVKSGHPRVKDFTGELAT